jgi:predicted transcriptional regulator
MKYRSRTDIINMVLDSARAGSTKTRIMYKAYLSYAQVTEYLKFLQENDLLTCEDRTHVYRVTEKGLKFLNASDELNSLITQPISVHFKSVSFS